MQLSVIIDSRRAGSWLGQVLTGYALQTWRDFEVIVLSGLDSPAAGLVAERRRGFPVALRHVATEGAPAAEALDVAIAQAGGEYLLFTRSDCLPRPDLVAAHAGLAARGRFLSGSSCRLGPDLSRRIGRNDIVLGRCFEPGWLQARGRLDAARRRQLALRPEPRSLVEALVPSAVRFDPRNASAWKRDLIHGRGDPAGRLRARGVRGRGARNRALCLQLSDIARDGAPAAAAPVAGATGHGEALGWRRYG